MPPQEMPPLHLFVSWRWECGVECSSSQVCSHPLHTQQSGQGRRAGAAPWPPPWHTWPNAYSEATLVLLTPGQNMGKCNHHPPCVHFIREMEIWPPRTRQESGAQKPRGSSDLGRGSSDGLTGAVGDTRGADQLSVPCPGTVPGTGLQRQHPGLGLPGASCQ